MATVHAFGLYSRAACEWLCELPSLESAMQEVSTLLGQQYMHKYFPLTVQLEDSDGKMTDICTVTLCGSK